MTVEAVRMGDKVRLTRRPVVIDPAQIYHEIGIRSFGKGIFHKDPVSGYELGEKKVYEIHAGELILSSVFAWEGAIALSSDDDAGFVGSHRFLTYLPVDSSIDLSYLRYFLLSGPGLRLIRSASPGAAGRNRTLGIKAFEELRFPLPSLPRQQRVSGRMKAFSQEYSYNNICRDRAEQLFDALRETLCRQTGIELRVGDHLELSRVPVRILPENHYQQIGIYSFGKGLLVREPVIGSEIGSLRYFRVPDEALVLSNIKAWEGAIAFSENNSSEYVGSNRFLSYLPSTGKLDPNFMRYFLLSHRGIELIRRASPGTADRNRTLGMKAFESLLVNVPDIQGQVRIASILDRAGEAIRRIDGRQRTFGTLVQAVLDDSFVWVDTARL